MDRARRGRRPAELIPGRLRWRLRGALQWPLFALLTLVDAVLLGVLPIAGTGTPFPQALLLAMFFNLVAVAALGRFVARGMRRRRPDLPAVVAEDRAGVVLLCSVTAALLVTGIVHAPDRERAEDAVRAQQEAVRRFVEAHGTPTHRRNLDAVDVEQHGPDFFRSCVPGDKARDVPALCVLVDTSTDPPSLNVDDDRSPNRHL